MKSLFPQSIVVILLVLAPSLADAAGNAERKKEAQKNLQIEAYKSALQKRALEEAAYKKAVEEEMVKKKVAYEKALYEKKKNEIIQQKMAQQTLAKFHALKMATRKLVPNNSPLVKPPETTPSSKKKDKKKKKKSKVNWKTPPDATRVLQSNRSKKTKSANGVLMSSSPNRSQKPMQLSKLSKPKKRTRPSPTPTKQSQKKISVPEEDVQDVVDISVILEKLETSSTIWKLIIDQEPKTKAIQEYINWFKQDNILIHKKAEHYA